MSNFIEKKLVGIAGFGFVGNALGHVFTEAVVYDKYKKIGTPESLNDCDYVFLCLPTRLDHSKRTFDLSAIHEVLKDLGPKPKVIVKSTVVPGTCRMLAKKYKRTIIFNPEFLRERSAVDDMINATHIVLGAETDELCDEIYDLYMTTKWMGNMFETDWETAELLKLTKNAYLATKVSFFNSIFDYAQKLNVNYETLKFIMNEDPLTHNDDIMITEERGWGGHCLPKDVNALITAMKKEKLDANLLEEVWQFNKKVRKNDPFPQE